MHAEHRLSSVLQLSKHLSKNNFLSGAILRTVLDWTVQGLTGATKYEVINGQVLSKDTELCPGEDLNLHAQKGTGPQPAAYANSATGASDVIISNSPQLSTFYQGTTHHRKEMPCTTMSEGWNNCRNC